MLEIDLKNISFKANDNAGLGDVFMNEKRTIIIKNRLFMEEIITRKRLKWQKFKRVIKIQEISIAYS